LSWIVFLRKYIQRGIETIITVQVIAGADGVEYISVGGSKRKKLVNRYVDRGIVIIPIKL